MQLTIRKKFPATSEVTDMAKFRRIGVLTSGGDAPGMNAAIAAVTLHALDENIEVVGINEGYTGLIQGDVSVLDRKKVANIWKRGGTILGSSRCPEFKTEEGMRRAIETCKRHNIDAIVAIGGDGTFRGATDLSRLGFPAVGIPGSIDNDITASDYTIGLDTATNTTIEMIDKLNDTCDSHSRCNVVEVMGRECGQIALLAGIATGAIAVAVPELPFDQEAALERIREAREAGKRGMIVVVSEGVDPVGGVSFGEHFAHRVNTETDVETRFARFAHVVRGGDPTFHDRLAATQMGVMAVDLLLAGHSNVVMCEIDGKTTPVDINFALISDRMYKGKLKPGDLDAFTPEQLEDMKALVVKRQKEIADYARLAGIVAK